MVEIYTSTACDYWVLTKKTYPAAGEPGIWGAQRSTGCPLLDGAMNPVILAKLAEAKKAEKLRNRMTNKIYSGLPGRQRLGGQVYGRE